MENQVYTMDLGVNEIVFLFNALGEVNIKGKDALFLAQLQRKFETKLVEIKQEQDAAAIEETPEVVEDKSTRRKKS